MKPGKQQEPRSSGSSGGGSGMAPADRSRSSSLSVVREEPAQEGTDGFSPEKLAAMQQINVKPSNARFMMLVDDLLRPESLPRGWSATFYAPAAKWVYRDKGGAPHDAHPVHAYYTGAMFMDEGGYAQLKAIAAARPPGADEVQQMGAYFGIKPGEDSYIWQVAEMGLCAPLPPGWCEVLLPPEQPTGPGGSSSGGGATSEAGGQQASCSSSGGGGAAQPAPADAGAAPSVCFKCEATGAVQAEHPLDDYFRELIRRRRRELLRRKRAALRSLQALVKMGMGRRSQIGAATAAAGAGSSEAETLDDAEPDSFDAETQAALQAAWDRLMGSATQLVCCMQAAGWDGGSSSSSCEASIGQLPAVCGSAPSDGTTAGGAQPGGQPSSGSPETPHAQQLRDLRASLALARRPEDGPSSHAAGTAAGTAADALADVQGLAAQVAAAGSDAAQLEAVLRGQGIPAAFFDPAGGESADDDDDHGDSSSPPWRSSGSLMGGTLLPFVGADGGGISASGGRSDSTVNEPWSLTGGRPDASGLAAAAQARSHAAVQQANEAGAATGLTAVAPSQQPAAAGGSDAAIAGAAAAAAHPQQHAAAASAPSPLLLHGGAEFPPPAQAALQHLASLQGTIDQALSLIRSWQQQRLAIAWLQQRLLASTVQGRASRRKLDKTSRRLCSMQQELEMQRDAAAACAEQCRALSAQLGQANAAATAAEAGRDELQQQLNTTAAELAGQQQELARLHAATTAEADSAQEQAAASQTAYLQLQGQVEAATADLASSQATAHQLKQQLAAATAEVAREQAGSAALQHQLADCQHALQALQDGHAQLLADRGSEAAAAGAELQDVRARLAQETAQHAASQQALDAARAALTAGQQQQSDLHAQLAAVQQQLSDLQAAHAALQQQHQQVVEKLQAQHSRQGAELGASQQQLGALQAQHAATLAERQALQHEQAQLRAANASLQGTLSGAQAELAAVQAAAEAAAQARAARPHKGSQVGATEAAAQHWTAARGVQTGEELDPRSRRDAGTAADLSLLSYFFREIKQKQRGGGGAILGYDPEQAAAASEVARSPKSWSGGLPPIASSSGGGASTLSKAASAALPKRPATMPGSLASGRPREASHARRPLDEDQEEGEGGGFDTRPPLSEVRQRVDRRRDRQIKLEAAKPPPGADRWDYAADERDCEIADLKRLLVEAEHRAKQTTEAAAAEVAAATSELQACKRKLEQAQADGACMAQELANLHLAIQAMQLQQAVDGGGSSGAPASRTSAAGVTPARLSSAFDAAAGSLAPGLLLQTPARRGSRRISSAALPQGVVSTASGSLSGSGGGPRARPSDALLSLSCGGGAVGGPNILNSSSGGGGGFGGSSGGSGLRAASMLYGAGRLSSLPNSLAAGVAADASGAGRARPYAAAAAAAAPPQQQAPALPRPKSEAGRV